MLQVLFLIYSIGVVVVFLLLIWAKNSGNTRIDYEPYMFPLLYQLTELGLFALIALCWPLFLIGSKIYKTK